MTREAVAAIALCLVTAIAMVAMVESHRPDEAMITETTVVATAPRSAGVVPPVAKVAYVGNTNKHKFHRQGCRYFNCPNCTAKFATREEAIAAGYRPCGTCNP